MLWLLLVVIHAVLISAQSSNGRCIDAGDGEAATTQYQLTCGPSEKILSVNVTSAKGSCAYPECFGAPAQLLKDTNNCYWKSGCSISFPTGLIIKPETDLSGCVFHTPRSLHINSYTCSKTRHQLKYGIDICGHLQGVKYDGGVLISHDDYPWMYDLDFGDKWRSVKTCSKTFFFDSGNTGKMVITVLDMDLAETDSLRVMTSQNSTTLTSGASLVVAKDSYKDVSMVKFEFTVSPDSTAGRGFVVCFIFVSRVGDNRNACDLLGMTHTSIYTTQPQETRPMSDMAAIDKALAPTTSPTAIQATIKKNCYTKKGKRRKCRPKRTKKRDGTKKGRSGRKGTKRRNGRKNKKGKSKKGQKQRKTNSN